MMRLAALPMDASSEPAAMDALPVMDGNAAHTSERHSREKRTNQQIQGIA